MSFTYRMGFRGPRCNGCKYAQIKHELGDKFFSLRNERGWTVVYELDAPPRPNQGEPTEYNGRSIRIRNSFMSIGHSDECYHWQPPDESQELG